MSKNSKWLLWLGIAALIALIIGQATPPGTIDRNPHPSPGVSSYHGRGQQHYVAPPAAVTAAAPANAATLAAPATSASPVAPAAPPKVYKSLGYSDLKNLLTQQPSPVSSLTFIVGTNRVLVGFSHQTDVEVLVPDEQSKNNLTNLAGTTVAVIAKEDKNTQFGSFITTWGPIVLIGLIMLWYLNRQRQAQSEAIAANQRMVDQMGNKTKSMGESRAKDKNSVGDRIKKVTFNDVAGCDEAVKELRRIVKGLAGKDVYTAFGAAMPNGILLIGPPGTGKTLLAKAVSGETDGTFDITSGSDFVEMLVGVGASRVRDMFDKARAKVAETKKPHVIFIDEIDAIGGKRGGGAAPGSNSEREQTLNQLLVEMDGVISNDGIIIIAATNRVDMLDEALLRQGRFDCHVQVDLPDRIGREAIFGIHLRNKAKLAEGVSVAALAQRTYTYSGAEIKGACDRAALIAAERWDAAAKELLANGKAPADIVAELPQQIAMEEFDEALDFVRYGGAQPTKQKNMAQKDKLNTSWHEAGHATVAALFEESDPVMKITIMRRARALGYVAFMPDSDRVSYTREQALVRMVIAMAGRAAQEVYLNGTCDSGASNDFQQATELARKMVTEWGMTKLGHISMSNSAGPFRGVGGDNTAIGSALADKVDQEVSDIVETCYRAAVTIVQKSQRLMKALVDRLMDKETVLADEWLAMVAELKAEISVEALQLPYWKEQKHVVES